MAVSDAPRQVDLDKCVHCGLCLNACPTYRELHVEMDSPRGRIYQMVQVANGAPISDAYMEHIDLCLACRACETACPSGVQYGRLVEAARADIEQRVRRPLATRVLRNLVFEQLLPSPANIRLAGAALRFYQVSGLRKLVRGLLPARLGEIESLAPTVETPSFYRHRGTVFPGSGGTQIPGRVALRVHREHVFCASERSHGSRTSSQWLRGDDSCGSDLLRSSARPCRATRTSPQAGSSKY